MIKEINKKDLAKFSIYPDININVYTTGDPNMNQLVSHIELMTNVPLIRDSVEYAISSNNRYEKEGYLTIEDITNFLNLFKKQTERIQLKGKIIEDSTHFLTWKLINND